MDCSAMNEAKPDHGIDRLEDMLRFLEHATAQYFKESNPRINACADRMHVLRNRLDDVDEIEHMLFEAYAATHPEAERDILAMGRATDWDFINLPSIKAMRDRD
jgi:hypothetical protein